jgi:DNA-binding SARP family transcriptional activator
MKGDPESGLRMINRALEVQSLQEDPALFALMLIRRATCYRLLGNYQMGLNDALGALDLSKKASGEKILEAESDREIGINQRRLGDIQEAKIHLKRSLKSYLDQNDQKNAAFVEMDLGSLEMNEGNYAAASSLYRQAHHLWEGLGNLNQLVGLCNNLGVLDHLTGKYLGAFDWFTQALEYARQTSNLRGTAFTLASLADLALDLGALLKAEAYINESRILADEAGETYLQIYLLLSLAALARKSGEFNQAREYLDTVKFQTGKNPDGIEMGKYHLELGCLLMGEDQLEGASAEFNAAQEIFSRVNMPVETTIALIYHVQIEHLRGSSLDGNSQLNRVQEIIQSLGTIQPLVPNLADQLDFLSSIKDHPPTELLIKKLIHSINDFQRRLPGLLDSMEFNRLPYHTSLSPSLEIYGMGRSYVQLNGELISVPEWTKQKTVRELFFYLLSRSEVASREEICLVFWPDSAPEQLKKQFKNALYRLRRAVGKDTVLYHQPTRLYHFNRDLDYFYDVEEFLSAAKQAEGETDPEIKIQTLQRAADLYQGPFAATLEGIWAEPVRYRLYRCYERSMLSLAELQLTRGLFGASLETSELLLQSVPSQEAAWRLAMRSHAAQGDRSGVERVFQQCRKALAQDLDAEPSGETCSLYQQLMI